MSFTDAGALVINVRYLCPEPYQTSRQTGSLGVEQDFPDYVMRSDSYQIGQRMTCDGTWNGLKVHARPALGYSRHYFSRRLPVTVRADFSACLIPTSFEHCVAGADGTTVIVE